VDLISLAIILSFSGYLLPIKPLSDLKNVLPGFMSKVRIFTVSDNTF